MDEQQPETGGDAGSEPQGTSGFLGVLTAGAWKIAARAPRKAVDLAHRGLTEAERVALSTLKRRMDAVAADEGIDADAPLRRAPAASATGDEASAFTAAQAPLGAAEAMSSLLEFAMEQTPEQARERLALRIVRQLVPDEARILAGLADGHPSALMHLAAGPLVGPASQRWLENLSPVGKECGVRLVDETPHYIAHLRSLGLLESGEEDKSLQLKYQILEADTLVRTTVAEIEKNGLRPKFFRRTIRISEAGKAFWAACEPKDRPGW